MGSTNEDLKSKSKSKSKSNSAESPEPGREAQAEKIEKSSEEWRRELTPAQYHVCRERGTEPAFTGEYTYTNVDGIYRCTCCGNELFDSNTKFDSGCGWPSFWDVADKSRVVMKRDSTHGMERTEVCCARCDAHLGHVFNDGPAPTELRYCINSVSLDLEKRE